jgi:hypothetical protein
MNKVLKDERGVLLIRDFQKMSGIVGEAGNRSALFVHFLAYFHKVSDLVQL